MCTKNKGKRQPLKYNRIDVIDCSLRILVQVDDLFTVREDMNSSPQKILRQSSWIGRCFLAQLQWISVINYVELFYISKCVNIRTIKRWMAVKERIDLFIVVILCSVKSFFNYVISFLTGIGEIFKVRKNLWLHLDYFLFRSVHHVRFLKKKLWLVLKLFQTIFLYPAFNFMCNNAIGCNQSLSTRWHKMHF